MKNYKMTIVAGICSVVLLFGTFANTVAAAEVSGESVTVKTVLSGTLPEKEESFVVEMAAENEDTPMPAGSKGGVYALYITGEGENSFPEITYSELGVYHYKIYQKAGTNKECTYDNTVYSLVIYVMNSELDPDSFTIAYALYNEDMSEKLAEVLFHNHYKVSPKKEEVKPTPKTGDLSNIDWYMAVIVSALMVPGAEYWKKKKSR